MVSHPPKRVRTGCLKCRVRRRKCDEDKPRCQRCVAGGFECQYGTRLSFLQKNAITAQGTEATGPSAAYRRVQFVQEPVAQGSKPETTEPSSSPSPANLQIVHETPYTEPRTSATARLPPGSPNIRRNHVASPTDPDQSALAEPSFKSPQSNYSFPEGVTPAGGYEIALDALLSLGEDKSGTPTDRGDTPESSPIAGGQLSNVDPAAPYAVTGSYVGGGPKRNARVLDGQEVLGYSESMILRLLRYYRYEVAPWLDICDLGHTFGLTVLCLTSMSNPILHAVVNFTTSLAGQAGDGETLRDTRDSPAAVSDSYSAQFPDADFSTRLLCQVLAESKRILTREMGGLPHQGIDELAEMFSTSPLLLSSRPLNTALYYLTLRIDLSESLVRSQPPRLPFWAPQDLPFDRHRSKSAAQVFRSASEILVLCARAANLVFGGHEPHAENRVEQWTSLLDSLSSWYSARCQKFKPMVEMDSKGDSFPLLLFTSGAGLMANQLYHTAMLLMLQNKPRTFRVSGLRMASTMSALWHARRVCGIALANDARECWDLSLVASFVVAARGMTHSDQHRLILEKLEEVEGLTGWKVRHYRYMLMEEWGI